MNPLKSSNKQVEKRNQLKVQKQKTEFRRRTLELPAPKIIVSYGKFSFPFPRSVSRIEEDDKSAAQIEIKQGFATH